MKRTTNKLTTECYMYVVYVYIQKNFSKQFNISGKKEVVTGMIL